ncbi:MAG: CBS domain-containing protein [Opitutaceae bacterium]|nr:CBS domain-containing protein [Opitutaceae bacterium]
MNSPISALLDSKESAIHTVPPHATVFEAVQKMVTARIGAVLVVDEGRLVGIFSERDVLVRVVSLHRDPLTTPVAHVMTIDPITIDASMPVEDVLDQHSGKEFRHLPVMDEGHLVGMVSVRDLLRWVAQSSNAQVD